MEYLVTMTTHVPDGTSQQAVEAVRTREAARSGELAERGHLLRLWRPPLQPGQWRTRDAAEMQAILAALPMDAWMTVQTPPLAQHPSDPAISTG
jgi:muconolactone D-isomerase